ncbi:cell division topological specificity factor MinE [Xenococcus sp. PCC 7305]|uniref:cell division topological specificity factor MinE n=1 Tax=Xenococcus sp. PCC 7305 TaxID=102125 RepID=UPI0002ACA836|nr:cell division topological specificity factor MinE [Xenococcus sp. PCC 7305]ELS02811.1 cell division topological specificity factor MinE [Xenococcus sp. PCC 7305]
MNDILDMLFLRNGNKNSRQEAKRRLQVVIAHDRASIAPDIIAAMREEILDVVARYVEINRDEMEFGLENNDRLTALTVNLPIRQIKTRLTERVQLKSPDLDIEQ